MVLSLLGMITHEYEEYGIINLPHAMTLLKTGFLDFWNYERDDQVAEFEVVEITPRFLRAMRKVYNETVESRISIFPLSLTPTCETSMSLAILKRTIPNTEIPPNMPLGAKAVS